MTLNQIACLWPFSCLTAETEKHVNEGQINLLHQNTVYDYRQQEGTKQSLSS